MGGQHRRERRKPRAAAIRARRGVRRAEARLRTGLLAHLAGGALDVLGALAGYGRERARRGRR